MTRKWFGFLLLIMLIYANLGNNVMAQESSNSSDSGSLVVTVERSEIEDFEENVRPADWVSDVTAWFGNAGNKLNNIGNKAVTWLDDRFYDLTNFVNGDYLDGVRVGGRAKLHGTGNALEMIRVIGQPNNYNKFFYYMKAFDSEPSVLWGTDGLAGGSDDAARGQVEPVLRKLGAYYEFGYRTGYYKGLTGLMGLIGFFIMMPVRMLAGVILTLLTLGAYVMQFIGTKIYGLIDVFNVFKWMEGMVTDSFANQVAATVKDPTQGTFLEGLGALVINVRAFVLVFVFISFGFGLAMVVVGINRLGGTRMQQLSGTVKKFVWQLFTLTGAILLLSALISGFSAAMESSFDEFGIQEEITGLISDYKVGIYSLYDPIGGGASNSHLEKTVNDVGKIADDSTITDEKVRAEMLRERINVSKDDDAMTKNIKTAVESNAYLYIAGTLDPLIDAYNGGLLSAKQIRSIANAPDSDYMLNKTVQGVGKQFSNN